MPESNTTRRAKLFPRSPQHDRATLLLVILDLADVPDVDFQLEDVPEGCAVVRTSDSAHDVKHLLRILYDGYEPAPSYLKPTAMGGLSFGHLAAAARLAQKYEVHFVLEETKSPSSLGTQGTTAAFHANDAIEAVNLFRTVSWSDTLPSAIYLCCQLPPAVLLSGHPRADGTLERLSNADVELYWTLQKRFITQARAIATKVFACEPKSARAHAEKDDAWQADPLGGLRLTRRKHLYGSVCAECARTLDERAEVEGKAYWEELVNIGRHEV
ncbi:hypothetical protein C8Q80DRAFT_1270061 [Daedaleopsis nitida]|nr:hypothetical protein C8Q80DRAFT_1270061 [Daedaleopsis nitida]